MKIQNLSKNTTYFGYEANGFTLETNEVSREMPAALVANTYLRQDVDSGMIRLLTDARDNNILRSMGIEIPTGVKPAPAPETKMAVVPRETVNLMKVELEAYLNGMRSLPEKVKYLEELITKGKPQAKGVAEALLEPLKAQLVNDVTSHPKEMEPSKQKTEETKPEVKSQEPMMNMGDKPTGVDGGSETKATSGDEGVPGTDGVKKAARSKALAQMSKLELLSYGTTIGCDINPMTSHKDLKEKVAAKEKELGLEFKK